MLISEEKKFIFVHNQKTAGVSVRKYLFDHVSDTKYLLPNHAYAVDGIRKLGREAWDGYYSFGFVRNPWDRLVSWYSMIVNGSKEANPDDRGEWNPNNSLWKYVQEHSSNFEEFIERCTDTITETRSGFIYEKSFVKNQFDYFIDDKGKIAVNFIGKFENLENDFDKVAQKLELPKHELPQINKTYRNNYREFYNDRTKKIVEKRFEKDISHFDYSF